MGLGELEHGRVPVFTCEDRKYQYEASKEVVEVVPRLVVNRFWLRPFREKFHTKEDIDEDEQEE